VGSHRLLLIRHAKTEQGTPDETRKLTDRGRSDAAAIGAWLESAGVVPDAVVISPATRARQTWELTGVDSTVSIDDRIYDNRPDNLLAIAREADEPVQTLAIVGHNPSIEWFMARHGGAGDVPTGTVVVFDVTGSWADGEIGFVRAETCRAD
jgi:phosphohistidine phosphatase